MSRSGRSFSLTPVRLAPDGSAGAANLSALSRPKPLHATCWQARGRACLAALGAVLASLFASRSGVPPSAPLCLLPGRRILFAHASPACAGVMLFIARVQLNTSPVIPGLTRYPEQRSRQIADSHLDPGLRRGDVVCCTGSTQHLTRHTGNKRRGAAKPRQGPRIFRYPVGRLRQDG